MPQSQTMWRAILVICLMSPAAPLEISSSTSSSAMRPPSPMAIWFHALLRMRENVLLRDEHRAAEAAAARDDGDLVHRHVTVIEDGLHERVPGLVVGRQLLLLVVHQAAAFAAELHLLARIIDVDHLDLLLVAAGGEQRGLVQQIGQFGAGKTGRAAGDDLRGRRSRRG
jgi:hypothetical protein